ncbi:hypothetical protein ACS0TY_008610 [Phlomoides rotata]
MVIIMCSIAPGPQDVRYLYLSVLCNFCPTQMDLLPIQEMALLSSYTRPGKQQQKLCRMKKLLNRSFVNILWKKYQLDSFLKIETTSRTQG